MKDTYYVGNLLQGFVWIALGIALLGLSGKLSEWPLWLVILLQYGILIGLAMGKYLGERAVPGAGQHRVPGRISQRVNSLCGDRGGLLWEMLL